MATIKYQYWGGFTLALGSRADSGSFEVAQLCGIRAKFETRSATFKDLAQLCDRRSNSCDGECNSFGLYNLLEVMEVSQHIPLARLRPAPSVPSAIVVHPGDPDP
ncbi:hypothetical protein FA13DRAFT_1706518 [Coprinellus micaceus]|uniref:Uncharacterized protein n=1 Tax=Coprinellus micaceus TaxID=71717 RepID=A0A4Y7TRT1_COPMI|nr:hypothetical protein FA13DRAFT_1706518 [Coprinellus micaceus]